MGKLTLDDLKKLREEQKNAFKNRVTDGKTTEITVGMGTCGLAAGAKGTLDAFITALDKAGLDGVVVRQTGCMGLCHSEPTVEIKTPDMPNVVYGNVNADVVKKLVDKHIINKQLLNNLIQDKPAEDIIEE